MQRLLFVFLIFSSLLSVQAEQGILSLSFLDSKTGYAVQPRVILAGSELNGGSMEVSVDNSGRAQLQLPFGDYTVTVDSESHALMTSAVKVDVVTPPRQFSMDPLVPPIQTRAENVIALHRPDAMVYVGFVVGEESGQPLDNVKVVSRPSGAEAHTDAHGFFQIYVPLQSDEEWKSHPAQLIFQKSGYLTYERHRLELWPGGDGILQIRLSSGEGKTVVDENGRRISPESIGASVASSSAKNEPVTSNATTPTNATIRIPVNIRVLLTNGTVELISLETYVQRSLRQEWIASWGNYPGGGTNASWGTNSLKAGAVAVRSYASWHVSNPRGSDHDICATTACQVYGTVHHSLTDIAGTTTAGYVVIDSNNLISRSEYSAENNSAGFSCGDGYTQPTGGCIEDSVCSGETRSGHGRGMCQWGTVKWATGLKFPGNGFSNTSMLNGQPRRDWLWIVDHYYPTLTLVQAKPLIIGDDVRVIGSSSRTNFMCSDGSISSGFNCTFSNFVKTVGSTGVITAGPVQVSSDGRNHTWWKITWSDNKVGWLPENWLERVIPVPAAPFNLHATAIATNQINLTWSTNVGIKLGYKIERSVNTAANWVEIDNIADGLSAFSDNTVLAASTNYYRIRAYNLGGNSLYSNTTNAITPGIPPTLAAITNRTVVEGTALIFTNIATAPDFVTPLTDFENHSNGDAVMFRTPGFSGSTSAHIEAGSTSSVTDSFPANASSGSRVMKSSWSFKTGTSNPWARLTTAGTANLPNPVIDFTRKLRFDIHTDKSLRVALGCRETTNAVGTAIGSDGGSSGSIEYVGVNSGTQPNPVRTVSANTWTTLEFNLPNEPVVSFVSGNGILSTASGLGVLEHLALVPNGGLGAYNVHLDNFVVAQAKTLTFSLDAGAPTGASVHPSSGIFTWTPTEAQGPGVYPITVRVTDNAFPPQSATRTFNVTVTESNTAPVLAAIANRTVHAGNSVVFTNSATDSDIPANALTFSLDAGAPLGASVHSTSGVFSWTPGDSFIGTTNSITVRVSDNGSPVLSDAKSFTVSVLAKPAFQGVTTSEGNINLSWSAISGRSYKVQFKNNLNEVSWTDLETIVATGSSAMRSEPVGPGQRYYRIIALD